jgi:anti-anti-sigma factor
MEHIKEQSRVEKRKTVSPDGSLTVDVVPATHSSRAVVVRLRGYLDLFTTGFLNRQLEAVEGDGVREILVDFREVGFVASVGVGAVVAWHKRFLSAGGKLVCFSMSSRAREVFSLLGFEAYLHMADNEQDALDLLDEDRSRTVFPRIADCPICATRLRLRSAGVYRCPQCSTVLRVSGEGRFSLG